MAKVQKKVARKAYPQQGIAAGDTYYKWSLRPTGRGKGTTYRSKTYPTRQQLTSSDFMRSVYDIEDQLSAISADGIEDGCLDDIVQAIRDLATEQDEKLENMPEGFREGSVVNERKEALEGWADDLENHANSIPDESEYAGEGETPEEGQEDHDAYVAACEEWINGLDTSYPG